VTPSEVDRLAGLVSRADRIVAFTGAGVSTESGIPDFRSPGGVWDRFDPSEFTFQNFMGSEAGRRRYWELGRTTFPVIRRAEPNPGHHALVTLWRLGKLDCVITQNIDNLHQASGIASEHVVELHGNTTFATCLDCAERYELAWVRKRFEEAGGRAPDCRCGGYIKTATVSFGQAMPEAAMRRAEELTLTCDLFLSIGSSLVVWPAAGFPLMAKRNGARLVIINRDPTDFDDVADLVIRADIGATLAPFIAH
jgi:NAD-dependent deacetylase